MQDLKSELYELIKSDQDVLDFIQDTSPLGIWYRDLENPGNEWVNPAFWLMLGYTPDEMQHQVSALQGLMNPDDLKTAEDDFNRHYANPGYPCDLALRYTHKNGSMVRIRCRARAIRNPEGKAIRMLATLVDITRGIESEERNRMLFDSIDEGFCIIEMIFDENRKPIDYRFLLINASFEKQTGLYNAPGKRMREFAPNHEEHWFEIYGKIALTGEPVRFQNRAEQLHRWYDVYAFRFGEPADLQVAILFNDITERKLAEDTIRSLNEELAQNLNQIEFINRELESFTYSVSHDLRAPLRSINGYVGMLEEDFAEDLPAGARKCIEEISRNTRKMSDIIDALLTLSRIERKTIEKKKVDTDEIVSTTIREVTSLDSVGETVFKTGNLLPAHGDTALLKQVWVNLISNAHKYSQKNVSPVVEIGSSGNGSETTWYVKDNGVGFDMKHYDKLFGVFHRLHTESEFEGTGVGLAIVKRIMDLHGGRVWAEARINEGACFYIALPAVEES